MAVDLKTMKSAVEQLAEERGIDQGQIIGAIEDALAAAYKKDYGKKGQIIRAKFDPKTGQADFYQVKIVVDENMIRAADEENQEGEEDRIHFNEEHHIKLADAKKIKQETRPDEELVFPLETEDDYGRIAAQTAKQVILQRLREAEKQASLREFSGREGQILNGRVQKIERGNIFIDLGRSVGLLPREEQVPGEYYRPGERLKVYLCTVEETPRGVNLRLSRAHPQFVQRLFELEVPELLSEAVAVKAIAREAGSRTKIAVAAVKPHIDPVGSMVGQRGVRVNTIINELGGEKIDIIEWSENPGPFVANALSPAKVKNVTLYLEDKRAEVEVEPDQLSLAVGRGGQNARLAAKLTGWKIEVVSPGGVKLIEE